MEIGKLLEAMLQSGKAPSSQDRMRNALGVEQMSGGPGGMPAESAGGGLTDWLSGMLGGGTAAGAPGRGEGMLGDILGDVGRAVGGQKNLAMGGLGALLGALLGGGGKSVGGAMGGGLMALLGTMAYQALKKSGQQAKAPLGLVKPQTNREADELERQSELVLRAMINATKADGRIDEKEIDRMMAKLEEFGTDDQGQRYMMTQMQKPMETEELVTEVRGKPELAAEIYAASLLSIEVDTAAEREYLDHLAARLGLPSQVTQNIENLVGLQQA
ncbi:MAG: tellurite resistance TerB family protein [Desulfuromonadaceae bacterium]|nr:tellurite resistance TerB family protein [Desulfuromonadaceae bacterium]